MGKETIIVLGGGASAASFDLKSLKNLGYVIGVNDAAIHVPVDCCITMDRTWFEYRWQVLREKKIPVYARREAVVNVAERWADLHIFDNDRHSNTMTLEPHRLNGINSGFCGLNLAFKMRPKILLKFGLDSKKAGYWYEPYPWQQGEKPRGLTSDWAYERWAAGLKDIEQQFKKAGIEWI